MADCIPYILVGNNNFPRETRHEIAPAHDCLKRLAARRYRRDCNLDFLGAFFSDKHFKFVAHMTHDIGVEFVSRDTHVARVHETSEGYDTDVRRPATDVDDHASLRLMHRKL